MDARYFGDLQPVDGFDGDYVRQLSYAEMENDVLPLEGVDRVYRLVELAVVDSERAPRFSAEDVRQISGVVLMRLFNAANDCNSLTDETVEEAEGN